MNAILGGLADIYATTLEIVRILRTRTRTMAKRKRWTAEDWARAEARLERLRARERELTAQIEADQRAEQAPKPSWRRRLGFR